MGGYGGGGGGGRSGAGEGVGVWRAQQRVERGQRLGRGGDWEGAGSWAVGWEEREVERGGTL